MTSAAAADQPNSCQMDVLVKETTEMLYVNRNLVRVRMRCGRDSVGVCCRTTEVGWTRHVFVFPIKTCRSFGEQGMHCSMCAKGPQWEHKHGGACTGVTKGGWQVQDEEGTRQ